MLGRSAPGRLQAIIRSSGHARILRKRDMIEAHAMCEAGSLTLTDGLAILLHRKLDALAPEQILEVRSADPSISHDVRAWARLSGHQMIHSLIDGDGRVCWIQRGTVQRVISAETSDWN